MPDTTLRVVVDLRGKGDLAAALRQQQQLVEQLNRTETRLVETRREGMAVQQRNVATAVALAGATAVATRSAVSGLAVQMRGQEQMAAAQRRAAEVAARAFARPGEAARVAQATAFAAPPAVTSSRTERAGLRALTVEELRRQQEEAAARGEALAGRAKRVRELQPGKEGADLREQYARTLRDQLSKDPVQLAQDLTAARFPVKTELKMLRGEEGFKQVNYPGKILEAGKAGFGLAGDEAQKATELAKIGRQLAATEEFRAATARQIVAETEQEREKAAQRLALAKETAKYLASPAGTTAALDLARAGHAATAEENVAGRSRAAITGAAIGTPEHRAALTTGFQKEGVEDLNNLRESVVRVQEREKWLRSKEGLAVIRQQARATQELNASQRGTRWAELAAQQGKFAGALSYTSERLKAVQEGMADVATTAGWAFAAASASIAGAVAVASPAHWQTLTKSFQLLGATVGQEFLPYIDSASLQLQRAAKWFESLDPATRRTAAGFALVGTGLLGAVAALPQAVASFRALADAAAMAGKAAASFGPAGQLVAGLGAQVAALGAAVTAVYALSSAYAAAYESGQNLAESLRGLREGAARAQGGILTVKDVENVLPKELFEKLKALDSRPAPRAGVLAPEEIERRQAARRKEFQEALQPEADMQARRAKNLAAMMPQLTDSLEQNLKDLKKDTAGRVGPFGIDLAPPGQALGFAEKADEAVRVRVKAIEDQFKALGLQASKADIEGTLQSEEKRRKFVEQYAGGLEVQKQRQAIIDRLQKQGGFSPEAAKAEELKRSYAGLLPQPAYVGIGQLQERLQLQALQPEGELDKDLARKQNDNLKTIIDKLGKIIENTERPRQQVPAFGP